MSAVKLEASRVDEAADCDCADAVTIEVTSVVGRAPEEEAITTSVSEREGVADTVPEVVPEGGTGAEREVSEGSTPLSVAEIIGRRPESEAELVGRTPEAEPEGVFDGALEAESEGVSAAHEVERVDDWPGRMCVGLSVGGADCEGVFDGSRDGVTGCDPSCEELGRGRPMVTCVVGSSEAVGTSELVTSEVGMGR